MPDRIDAEVQSMESSTREPVLDRVFKKAKFPQLGARHDAMLLSRQLRDRHVYRLPLLAKPSKPAYIAG